jgi:hypothetical protein
MKNYMEQFKVSLLSGADDYGTGTKVLDGETDVKIQKNKLYDTSGDSVLAFAALVAGNVVKMSGWAKEENNGIFKVVDVASDGEWIQLDMPLVDELTIDSPGVTMYKTPKTWTVTGVTVGNAEIIGAVDLTNPSAFGAEYFKVTAANTVSSFANLGGDTDGDDVVVYWADLTKG